jgi:hypothetical protein
MVFNKSLSKLFHVYLVWEKLVISEWKILSNQRINLAWFSGKKNFSYFEQNTLSKNYKKIKKYHVICWLYQIWFSIICCYIFYFWIFFSSISSHRIWLNFIFISNLVLLLLLFIYFSLILFLIEIFLSIRFGPYSFNCYLFYLK